MDKVILYINANIFFRKGTLVNTLKSLGLIKLLSKSIGDSSSLTLIPGGALIFKGCGYLETFK